MRGHYSVRSWAAALAAILTALVALLSLSGTASTQEACPPSYATDHIIVGMASGASAESLESMKSLNGEGGEENFFQNAWSVDLPAGLTVMEAIKLYATSPDVAYAEADPIASLDSACDEPGTSLVEFTANPEPAFAGQDLTYELTARNAGSRSTTNANFWTFVPEETRFVSSTLSVGGSERSCPPNERGAIECRVGDLAAGEEAKLTLVVRPMGPGRFSNLADAWADNSAPFRIEAHQSTEVLAPPECTVVGTSGPDLLLGTSGRDVICGFDGEDIVSAGGGDDIVYGGSGDDTIFGGAGSDRLGGGEGNDTLRSRDGMKRYVDRVRGGTGEDDILADSWDRVRTD
jgi:uncharacterized repeat protein (TIGR01451 family)